MPRASRRRIAEALVGRSESVRAMSPIGADESVTGGPLTTTTVAPPASSSSTAAGRRRRAARRARCGRRPRPWRRRRARRGTAAASRSSTDRRRRRATIARAIGCSLDRSTAAARRRTSSAVDRRRAATTSTTLICAGRQRAGLVEHDARRPAGWSPAPPGRGSGCPPCAPRPVPTSRAVGVARPERARAGDDQHGDGGRERIRQAAGARQPRSRASPRRGAARSGRTRRPPGRPAVAPAPCPTGPPRPAG